MHKLRSGCRQLVKVLAIERIDQVDFPALEAQYLHIMVRLNIESYRVQVG